MPMFRGPFTAGFGPILAAIDKMVTSGGNRSVLVNQLVGKIWDAVRCLHAAGVAHLDLYPSNFMTRAGPTPEQWEVCIIDFDAAVLTDAGTKVQLAIIRN